MGNVTFKFWCDQMREAATIFREAGRPDFAKGIEYARRTAEKLNANTPRARELALAEQEKQE